LAERLLCKERVRSSSLLVSTNLEAVADNESKISGPPEAPQTQDIDPLIHALPPAGRSPTSGSLGTTGPDRSSEVPLGGPHLYNWIVFGRNEEIFDFAELVKDNDPDRSQPVD
jgi:hypothetical protein